MGVYYFGNSPVPTPHQSPKATFKKELTSLPLVEASVVRSEDMPSIQVPSNNFSVKEESLNFERDPHWEKELGEILQQLDPENSNQLFKSYQTELASFDNDLKSIVATDLNKLLRVHVQTDYFDKPTQSIYGRELLHQARMKKIFGENYDFIHERYQIFKVQN